MKDGDESFKMKDGEEDYKMKGSGGWEGVGEEVRNRQEGAKLVLS